MRWPPSGRWGGAVSCGSPAAPDRVRGRKLVTAMTLGLLAVVVEFAVGAAAGVRIPASVWLLSGLAAWVGSLVFAAFGLFIGYLAPAENVMQIIGPVLAVLAMFGGLFVPVEVLPDVLQQVAKFTRCTAWACWPAPH
ncbi:ABC transporter permease [Micromonospora sp. M12]